MRISDWSSDVFSSDLPCRRSRRWSARRRRGLLPVLPSSNHSIKKTPRSSDRGVVACNRSCRSDLGERRRVGGGIELLEPFAELQHRTVALAEQQIGSE